MMDGEESGNPSLKRRSYTSEKLSQNFGISANSADGFTNTAINTEADFNPEDDEFQGRFESELNWNKLVENMADGYIDFILKVKERKLPFFNLPLAETNAFKDLLST